MGNIKEEEKKTDRRWRFIIPVPFLISLFIHMGLGGGVIFFQGTPIQMINDSMEIEWVEIEENKAEDKLKKVQVVEQKDRLNDIKPTKDYKLSQFDQKVKEETRATKTGKFKNTLNKKEGQKVSQQNPQQQQAKPIDPDNLSLSDLKPTMFSPSYKPTQVAQPHSGGEVSQSDDYLKNVKLGAQTLLSTREFIYYSYYNRIKNKLRQHWEPRIKKKIVKILKRGRTIASTKEKITRLVITLDKSGQLVRVTLKGASGYNDLDDAAIEAFKAAAPFPNPPIGIVDTKGEIKINWDFVLET